MEAELGEVVTILEEAVEVVMAEIVKEFLGVTVMAVQDEAVMVVLDEYEKVKLLGIEKKWLEWNGKVPLKVAV